MVAQERIPVVDILIVEDHSFIRNYLADQFSRAGYQVAVAENGRQGVAATYELWPRVVLCDVMMPELSGFGLLRELQMNPATAAIPVILISGEAHASMHTMAVEQGAVTLLAKESPFAELLAVVQVLMQGTNEHKPARRESGEQKELHRR
jgi:two-component system, sensor histidine kinase and response regulator